MGPLCASINGELGHQTISWYSSNSEIIYKLLSQAEADAEFPLFGYKPLYLPHTDKGDERKRLAAFHDRYDSVSPMQLR